MEEGFTMPGLKSWVRMTDKFANNKINTEMINIVEVDSPEYPLYVGSSFLPFLIIKNTNAIM